MKNFHIVVTAQSHDDCLFLYKKFNHYLSAWFPIVSKTTHYKSARKGDVLRREIQIQISGNQKVEDPFTAGLLSLARLYELMCAGCAVNIVTGR